MSVFVPLCQKCYSKDVVINEKTKKFTCKRCHYVGKPFDASDDDRLMKEYLDKTKKL